VYRGAFGSGKTNGIGKVLVDYGENRCRRHPVRP
jgi:hypothetical protein